MILLVFGTKGWIGDKFCKIAKYRMICRNIALTGKWMMYKLYVTLKYTKWGRKIYNYISNQKVKYLGWDIQMDLISSINTIE